MPIKLFMMFFPYKIPHNSENENAKNKTKILPFKCLSFFSVFLANIFHIHFPTQNIIIFFLLHLFILSFWHSRPKKNARSKVRKMKLKRERTFNSINTVYDCIVTETRSRTMVEYTCEFSHMQKPWPMLHIN